MEEITNKDCLETETSQALSELSKAGRGRQAANLIYSITTMVNFYTSLLLDSGISGAEKSKRLREISDYLSNLAGRLASESRKLSLLTVVDAFKNDRRTYRG
jgi:hypothetical protein